MLFSLFCVKITNWIYWEVIALKRVYDYLIKEVKLKDQDIIVVGCSGGPDSMALMYILMDIRKKINIKIICAHVNHNVRVESKNEEKFLQEYCNEHDIIFEAMTIEKYGDDNFHNEARKIRYQFFDEIINKYNANYLMTAHHGDDLMETILMRIVRGSTLKGYAGFEKIIKKSNYTLVRPLIFVTKEELEQFDNQNNIPFVIDKSNFKGKYTRNRYRKTVLPFLKEEDPNVHNKFLKFSDVLIEYNDYIDNLIEKKIGKIYVDQSIDIDKFLEEEPLIQKKILFYIFEHLYQDDLYQINMTNVNEILNLIESKHSNASIDLPGNYKAIKEYNKLKFVEGVKFIDNYKIELEKYVELPNGHFISLVSDEEKNDNNVCRISSSDITLPLYVRTRCLGDKMALKKINGRKKLKDIFIDSKVPVSLRDSWPVVVDSKNNILWIPGVKKSKFSKQKNESYDIILKYN